MATSNYQVDLTRVKNTQRYCFLNGSKCINGVNEENLKNLNENARRRRRGLDYGNYESEIDLAKLSQSVAFKNLLDEPVKTNAPLVQVCFIISYLTVLYLKLYLNFQE